MSVEVKRLVLKISLWSGTLLGSLLISLLLLQALFGRQMERLQIQQLGRNLALNVRLTELTLERYPPALISDLTGLDLIVRDTPPHPIKHQPPRSVESTNYKRCSAIDSATAQLCTQRVKSKGNRMSGLS
jgi:two-component system osmolarity sensor histidine kinase EnvZ